MPFLFFGLHELLDVARKTGNDTGLWMRFAFVFFGCDLLAVVPRDYLKRREQLHLLDINHRDVAMAMVRCITNLPILLSLTITILSLAIKPDFRLAHYAGALIFFTMCALASWFSSDDLSEKIGRIGPLFIIICLMIRSLVFPGPFKLQGYDDLNGNGAVSSNEPHDEPVEVVHTHDDLERNLKVSKELPQATNEGERTSLDVYNKRPFPMWARAEIFAYFTATLIEVFVALLTEVNKPAEKSSHFMLRLEYIRFALAVAVWMFFASCLRVNSDVGLHTACMLGTGLPTFFVLHYLLPNPSWESLALDTGLSVLAASLGLVAAVHLQKRISARRAAGKT